MMIKNVCACVLKQPYTRTYDPAKLKGMVSIYGPICFISTLKGTPNLYFLSEVLTIITLLANVLTGSVY